MSTWSMLDVLLVGLAISYVRLKSDLSVELGLGALLFIVVAILGLMVRASLDVAQVWRLISPDRDRPDAPDSIACPSCSLLVSRALESQRCPRCSARVRARKPYSLGRSLALLSAAVLLYIPANLYPIAEIPIDSTPTAYTVLGGVIDLFNAHLFGLAALVFTASFVIPLAKMAGLSWCMVTTMHRSRRHLVGRTRVYRVIEEVGRWSMVDPMTIACFVPVIQFNSLLTGHAEPAATPFAAVVILTTWAVKCFDPRSMWDVARESHDGQ